MLRFYVLYLLFVALLASTHLEGQTPTIERPTVDQFNDYWYAGDAELTRYALQQVRYGEVHEGDAVLIFVTCLLYTSPSPRDA